MRIIAQILFALLFSYSFCLPQSVKPEFSHLTLEDGLSQSVVLDIVQDSTGFLWIATQDGLNRYDGYEFKIFRNNPDDSASLSDNWITSLCVADDTTLFVGTLRGGLNMLNLKTYAISRIALDSAARNSQLYISVLKQTGNTIFAGTWGKGLFLFDKKTGDVTKFTTENSDIPENKIRAIENSGDGRVLIGTVNGATIFNRKTASFEKAFEQTPLIEPFVLSIKIDSFGNWWIGTRKGLNVYLPKEKRLLEYYRDKIGDDLILDIFEDKNGYVWLATNHAGVSKTALSLRDKNFDYEKIKFHNYRYSHSEPHSISGNYVRKIFQDKSEILWFGTWGASLSKLDAKPPKFVKITPYNLLYGKLSNPLIRAFAYFENRLWIGTAVSGIDVYDKRRDTFENFRLPEFPMNNEVLTFFPDAKTLYIGTYAGLNVYRNGKFVFLPINKDLKSYPKIISVYSILRFGKNLLLGTTMGFVAFNLHRKKFYLPQCSSGTSPENFSINYMTKDSRGNVWAATKYNFLLKLNVKEKNGRLFFEKIEKINAPDEKKFPGQKRVNFVFEDANRNLWLATSQGLIRFSPEDYSMKIFTRKDGLANEIIYAILQDKEKALWISTNNGLGKLTFANGSFKIKNYFMSDGLQSNEFIQGSCFALGDTLFFGGINGYNFFVPERIEENPYAPRIAFTDLKIVNKSVPLPRSFPAERKLALRYSDKIFTFVFAALEFTQPKRNLYSFYLEGFNEAPTVQRERKITYTNLDPGNYILKVKAANNDGVWSEQEYAIALEIVPPFWLTWQFRLLLLILFGALVAYLARLRYKRLLETEKLRTKIASDLHDDVGSMLTQISIYSELIDYETTLEKAKAHAKFISNKSREIIGAMSDIIWSIDSRYDKMENLIDRMREFGANITQGKNIKFVFDVSVPNMQKELSAEARQNIFMIFKEAVNNAVKYSGKDKIEASLSYENGVLRLTVRDFGEGVEIAKLKRLGGLRNMEMRAKRIGGKIEFINDGGFKIILTIKM